jgi:predicted phosphate transport protein (TIGR00153 family)
MDWFGKRRESLVMKQLRNHALKVYDTISELNIAIESISDEDPKMALDAIKRVLLSEKAADNLEESISEEVSKGDLTSRQREDLLHMVRRMDYGADWAKEAAMNLNLIVEAEVIVPKSLWIHYLDMTGMLKEAAFHLKEAVESLGKDESSVLDHWRHVEKFEHELDDKYFQTKKEILVAEMDARAIFLMRDILHGMENSADSCKDAADTIHIFVTAEMYQR